MIEVVVDLIGYMHMVRCKVCFKVESKEKFLNLKLDGLQNHVRQAKCFSCSSRNFDG